MKNSSNSKFTIIYSYLLLCCSASWRRYSFRLTSLRDHAPLWIRSRPSHIGVPAQCVKIKLITRTSMGSQQLDRKFVRFQTYSIVKICDERVHLKYK